EVEPVEHLRLLVDRRLGGVQVLGAAVVVEQPTRAEPDDLPGDVADRPHYAAAEAVVDAALTLREESGGGELLAGEPLRGEGVEEARPPLRRVAHAEVRGGAGVEAALPQESAGGLRVG